MISYRALQRAGILGINRRNIEYTLRVNRRRLYPLVDDKLATKRLCEQARVPTGKVLGSASVHAEVKSLVERLEGEERFVLKPARGAMGNGIMVIRGRSGDAFLGPGDRRYTSEDLGYHAKSIISGMFALGGNPDVAFAEELLELHPAFEEISTGGVPDVRIVAYQNVPVMAMVRLPTERSRGRANLHQGAVGAGIDLVTGRTRHAVIRSEPVERHPDTGESLMDRQIPSFDVCLETALRAVAATRLGYVGADIVVDARFGPILLELNARPGLAIQVANRAGLIPRLRAVDARRNPSMSPEERIALGREIAHQS